MRASYRLLALILVLVSVILVSAYAVTVLTTQTVPSTTIRKPAAGAIMANCGTLTLSQSILDPGTSGYVSLSCASDRAFDVTTSGTFIPTFQLPYVIGAAYTGLNLVNFTTWQNGNCNSAKLSLFPTQAIAMSAGSYVYCLSYDVSPYSSQTASSIPSFTITWNSP